MKNRYLFISLVSILMLLCGCHAVDSGKVDKAISAYDEIPLIVFSENIAYQATWEIENAVLIQGDTYYEYEDTENAYNYIPILWDGKNSFLFLSETITKFGTLDISYLKDELTSRSVTVGTNAKATPLNDMSGYNIQLNLDDVNKNIILSAETVNYDGESYSLDFFKMFLGYISYTDDNLLMIFSDFDNFKMLIALYSTTHETWEFRLLNTPTFEDECARSYPVDPGSCVMIDNRIYFNYGGVVACLNLSDYNITMQNNITNKCWELVKELDIEDVNYGGIAPAGNYGDIMLMYLPVSFGEYQEFLLIAFLDQEYLGTFYVKNNQYAIFKTLENENVTFSSLTYNNITFPRQGNIVFG